MRRALTLVLILVVCIPASAQGQAPAVTNADATKHADSYVGKLSPEQKIDYIGGTYRGYQHNNVKPRFAFGFGRSYSTFKINNLSVAAADPSAMAPSGRPALYTVTFDVTNTSSRAGSEVAQVYVGEAKPTVPRPAKELKGFSRVELAAGETKHMTLLLDARAFAFYDAAGKHWQADAGTFSILVGDSSAETALSVTVTLPKAIGIGTQE
jgi:beta-glucosidase